MDGGQFVRSSATEDELADLFTRLEGHQGGGGGGGGVWS
jgi:hypothetical protein